MRALNAHNVSKIAKIEGSVTASETGVRISPAPQV
jgi:hypothetical protein